MCRRVLVAGAVLACLLAQAPAAHAVSSDTAALQVALKALRLYQGPIDGIAGPGTRRAVRRFQRRRQLPADGVAGPRTRRALGRRGGPRLGARPLRAGRRGWDVAALQFLLRRRGADPGSIDGGFGPGTRAAVIRFQRSRGLTADGVVGAATLSALRSGRRRSRGRSSSASATPGGPVRFLRPIAGPFTDGFGMRGSRPHHGLDFPASHGTPVTAAGVGTVSSAGYNAFGYGNLIVVQHRLGFETWYAHLSSIAVLPGQAVSGGVLLGRVGSTGHSTGPHLHWEVRHRGRPIDPLPRLLN